MFKNIIKNVFNAFLKPYIAYQTLTMRGAKMHLRKIHKTVNKSKRVMLFTSKYEYAKPLYHN